MIHTGDCLDVMATLEAESVSAIITDPPYGLHFMGKTWDQFPGTLGRRHTNSDRARGGAMHAGEYDSRRDREFQVFSEAWAHEAFRVAKPGAHLLSFGSTRRYHRMASGIEDAGCPRSQTDPPPLSGHP